MTLKNILIIGATSGIAEAVARLYAGQGCRFVLVARDPVKLDVIASDLQARGAAEVQTQVWDARDPLQIVGVADQAWHVLGDIHLALVAHGTLPDQERATEDLAYMIEQFRVNGESAVACMSALAPRFERQGFGTLAVIGSVAGDRGRPSNFVYGAAKGSLETFASGLRARMFRRGAHLLLVKPGFVATPMTAGLDLPARLTATPERVAQDIARAVGKRRGVLYTPWFWAVIMLIIRCIPGAIFKRAQL